MHLFQTHIWQSSYKHLPNSLPIFDGPHQTCLDGQICVRKTGAHVQIEVNLMETILTVNTALFYNST
jgi:hypothetical protein